MAEKAFKPATFEIELGDEGGAGLSTDSTRTMYRNFCYRWKAGALNFQRLESLKESGASDWKSFESSLVGLQLLSWKLLTDWLNGNYHPTIMARAARTAIFSRPPGPYHKLSSHPAFPVEARLEDSVYQDQLSELYSAEFLDFYDNDDPAAEYFLQLLDLRRGRGARFAISQYVAHATYLQLETEDQATTPAPDHTWHYSAPVFDVCPWLAPPKLRSAAADEGYPHFLWDIVNCCTIETTTLKRPLPAYTCVSHTWGRWRLDTSTNLQGVPWEVPRNSIFGVEHFQPCSKSCGPKFVQNIFGSTWCAYHTPGTGPWESSPSVRYRARPQYSEIRQRLSFGSIMLTTGLRRINFSPGSASSTLPSPPPPACTKRPPSWSSCGKVAMRRYSSSKIRSIEDTWGRRHSRSAVYSTAVSGLTSGAKGPLKIGPSRRRGSRHFGPCKRPYFVGT